MQHKTDILTKFLVTLESAAAEIKLEKMYCVLSLHICSLLVCVLELKSGRDYFYFCLNYYIYRLNK